MPDGSINFFAIKAKGKLTIPESKWTRETVHSLTIEIMEIADHLVEIQKKITSMKSLNRLIDALAKHPTTQEPSQLGGLFGLGSHSLGILHSNPVDAIPPSDNEIHPSPTEKE